MTTAALLLLVHVAAAPPPRVPTTSAPPLRIAVEPAGGPSAIVRARYVASRPGLRGLALPAHEALGFSQRARLLADGTTEVTVVTQADGSPRPARPPEARPPAPSAPEPEAIALLSQELALGAADPWELSERVLTWVSVNVRHEDEPAHDETPEATLQARTGSCVGRSRLAVALLRSAGVPARTIHGLLAEPGDGREFLLHRWVETWLDGAGWVPSDPGQSIHVVDARHVFLATDDEAYEPERQRELRLRSSERPSAALLTVPAVSQRPLIVGPRPRLARPAEAAR